jgi:hypothetical protein
LDGLIIRGVTTLRIVHLQLGSIVAGLYISESRIRFGGGV